MKPQEVEDKNILQAFREAGRLESQGEFTVRSSKALEALGAFQLPFEGAWAVKVVQAVVCQGTSQAIHVKRTRNDTLFQFALKSNWAWSEIEDEFFTAALGENASLNHLKVALWSLALGEKRDLALYQKGEKDCIVWQGGKLTRKALKTAYRSSFFQVQHASTKAQSEHIELHRALRERCFVCPVPLSLDARRLDALHLCPCQGWSPTRWPLALGFLQNELPPITIPQGTQEGQDGKERRSSILPLPDPLPAPFAHIPPSGHATLIYQFAFHARFPKLPSAGTSVDFETLPGRSFLHWILDGAVMQSEKISSHRDSACSLGLYLSAQDLEVDLTSLQLRHSPQKAERERQAWSAFRSVLPAVHWTFENTTHSSNLLSLGLTVAGVLGLSLPGFQSLLGCGALYLGLAGYFNSKKELPLKVRIERIKVIQKEFRTLRESLK